MKQWIDQLFETGELSGDQLLKLLEHIDEGNSRYLFEKARIRQHEQFGHKVYTRGLIELTNYCKNDCYYCGIRRSNQKIDRYRLTKEQILSCCKAGYPLGFRTFVLQGGEDGQYTDDALIDVIQSIKQQFPDCAITLSLGERSYDSYARLYQAGADRYLLRHETANAEHYHKLHPKNLSLEHRMACLNYLKEIGYQVGTGFMVGSPYQTKKDLVQDLLFIKEFSPQMVGIGPFIPHHHTPFANETAGTLEMTLFLIGILRLMIPNVLLPSTTALGTIHPKGRELGILAGANVVMPNLSPLDVREKYMLYDNKICTGDEAAECRNCLEGRMNSIGYHLAAERGDFRPIA